MAHNSDASAEDISKNGVKPAQVDASNSFQADLFQQEYAAFPTPTSAAPERNPTSPTNTGKDLPRQASSPDAAASAERPLAAPVTAPTNASRSEGQRLEAARPAATESAPDSQSRQTVPTGGDRTTPATPGPSGNQFAPASAQAQSPRGDVSASPSLQSPAQAFRPPQEAPSPASSSAPERAAAPMERAAPALERAPVSSSSSPVPMDRPLSQPLPQNQQVENRAPVERASGADNRPANAAFKSDSPVPNPSPVTRSPQEMTGGDRTATQSVTAASATGERNWYSMKAANAASSGSSDQIQRTPSGSTTVSERAPNFPSTINQPVDRGAASNANPFINNGDVKVDKTPGTRSAEVAPGDNLIADGKGGATKGSSWIEGPENSTRKPEVGSGQIGYGVTPDGKEHPFGLAGRMLDGKLDGGKSSGATAGDTGHGGAGGDGGASVLGQIFDGRGWKPNIQIPLVDKIVKGGRGREDKSDYANDEKDVKATRVGNKDGTTGDSKPTGRRNLDGTPLEVTMHESKNNRATDAKPPRRAADGSILEVTINDGELGGKIKQAQGVKDGGTRRPDKSTSVAETFVGLVDSVRSNIINGVKINTSTKSDSKSGAEAPVELTLTGVRTRPMPVTADGSPTSTVAILTPFLVAGGLRVSKNIAVDSNWGEKTEAAEVKGEGQSTEVVQMLLESEGPAAARFLEEGKLKARPSVSMHVPGGKYSAEGEIKKGEGSDLASKIVSRVRTPTSDMAKPWISYEGEGAAYADLNNTVIDIEMPLETLTAVEDEAAEPEQAIELQRPAKAIDELEATAQLTPAELRELKNGNKDDRYLYITQDGDTVESVALTVLKAAELAPLLFSMNRKYVLPEVLYGVHPLMVGVVIRLPTPNDILKFGQ